MPRKREVTISDLAAANVEKIGAVVDPSFAATQVQRQVYELAGTAVPTGS
jgi:hypothetical protein